jgi:hypothetical protein
MDFIEEISCLVSAVLPCYFGIFPEETPDGYAVITPLTDSFGNYADDHARHEISTAQISVFTIGGYRQKVRDITASLLEHDFIVTSRFYAGQNDNQSGVQTDVYHHYVIEVEKLYGNTYNERL